MGSSRLPPELTDRIIDFCHNDKRTLSNCALTHSSWLAASRFHLFRTITTTGVHERTSRAVQLASFIRKRPFSLLHRHRSVIQYIKTVKIDSLTNSDRTARLRDAVRLVSAIRLFCNRECLPIPPVQATLGLFLGNDTLQSFSLVRGIVTHVALSNATFGRPSDIWSFLSSFPRLQYLELGDVVPIEPAESGFPLARIFDGVPLSTIRITTAFTGIVLDGLIKAAGSLSHLADFGIVYQDIKPGALPRLADAIQGRVKCLRLSEGYSDRKRGGERPPASDTSEQTNPTPMTRKLTGWMSGRNPGVCQAVSVIKHARPG